MESPPLRKRDKKAVSKEQISTQSHKAGRKDDLDDSFKLAPDQELSEEESLEDESMMDTTLVG